MKEIKDEYGQPYYIPTTAKELGCCVAIHANARRHKIMKPSPEDAAIKKDLIDAGLRRG